MEVINKEAAKNNQAKTSAEDRSIGREIKYSVPSSEQSVNNSPPPPPPSAPSAPSEPSAPAASLPPDIDPSFGSSA